MAATDDQEDAQHVTSHRRSTYLYGRAISGGHIVGHATTARQPSMAATPRKNATDNLPISVVSYIITATDSDRH